MSDEEVGWVTNRHKGEQFHFKSSNGILDTLSILETNTHNDIDFINWGYFNTSSKAYIAYAYVRYGFSNQHDGGVFIINKYQKDKPICFSTVILDDEWLYDIPLNITSMWVDGIKFDDIMLFEYDTLKSHNETKQVNSIKSHAWSKKYGLVQYTFQDGTVFNRTDINQ